MIKKQFIFLMAIILIFSSSLFAGVELVFNDPPLSNNIDLKVISFISGATSTLDIAIYNLTNRAISDKIIAVKKKGVKVRIVTESDNWNDITDKLVKEGIPVVKDSDGGGGEGLMHDKFIIRDKKDVLTGSFNFTYPQIDLDKNCIVILTTASGAASIYSTEFNQMFVNKKFGAQKNSPAVTKTKVGSTNVEIYFSPKSNIISRLVSAIETCNSSILFNIFTFYNKELADAMIAQKKLGRKVKGVFDRVQAEYEFSRDEAMIAAGCDIRYDNYVEGSLHEKNMTIDAGTSSDPLCIIGSFNYTTTANTTNDENIIIIHSPTYSKLMKANIENIYNKSAARSRTAASSKTAANSKTKKKVLKRIRGWDNKN
ncbi:MAG TPA: phospholipase D-like domain-containing protein [bacterium]|nr:phospholipase D-like domain-containing protein [bacterium]HPN30426.1 phospholipase D-like domain-containing protein [bacterium]